MRFPFEPPPAREFDAVGFGLNAVDYLVVVPHYPAYDTKVRLVEHERGAVVYHEGRFVESHAFPVPGGCRDTTGAGDAFHTGFIYGMLRGEEVEGCLTLGCAVAALKCRALGARSALPFRQELENFLGGEGETS